MTAGPGLPGPLTSFGREPATHLAYLAVSLVLLPLAAVQTAGDDGAWSGALLIVGLLALGVVVLRMQTTWRGDGA